MQGASWISLFRRIPANLHDGLILTLSTGSEVVVQKFVKLDSDVVILRGRMAGTQDNGRVVILPYTQLVAINFTRRMLEPEVEAVFGKNTQTFAAPLSLAASSADGADANMSAEPEEQTAAPEPASAKGPAKSSLPSKAELLAKLRARLS